MGKFTQSVRRIVQDVKDEGTMSGLSREEVIEINERLILFRFRLEMSYETAKQALNSLMARYGDSKSQRNIFNRYPLLKIMIKVSKQFANLSSLCGETNYRNHSNCCFVILFLDFLRMVGSDQTRDSILDTRGNPQTRKTRNSASIRDESMYNHGKDSEVRAENTTEAVRGSR